MKNLAYIICMISCIAAVSCTKAPDCRELEVPEIVSITSLPDIHSAVLISDLKQMPSGRLAAGFYYGKDRINLKRVFTDITGRNFKLTLNNLEEGTTYYFKAFVSNGRNEIASGFESFLTGTEPPAVEPEEPGEPDTPEEPEGPSVPDNPSEPETPSDPVEPEEPDTPVEPEDPEVPDTPDEPTEPEEPKDPENPDTPVEPEEPSEPVEPEVPDTPDDPEEPVEFSVTITGVSASLRDQILELTATLEGDVSLVTECWFMVGFDPTGLSRIQGSKDGNSFKAYLAGLDPGTYYYQGVISNGSETRQSELTSYTINE